MNKIVSILIAASSALLFPTSAPAAWGYWVYNGQRPINSVSGGWICYYRFSSNPNQTMTLTIGRFGTCPITL